LSKGVVVKFDFTKLIFFFFFVVAQIVQDSCLDEAVLVPALHTLLAGEQHTVDTTLSVVDAFDVPKWTFDVNSKAFRRYINVLWGC
jgi:hypothetical protein